MYVDVSVLEEIRRAGQITEYEVYPQQTEDVDDYQVKAENVPSVISEDVRMLHGGELIAFWEEEKGIVWSKLPKLLTKTPQRLFTLTGNIPSSASNGGNTWLFFSDAEEAAELDEWPAVSTKAQIERSTDQAKSGSYSFMADSTNQASFHEIAESTNKRVLAWFYDVSGTANDAVFIGAGDGATDCYIAYNNLQSETKYTYRIGGAWTVTDIVRITNAWNKFEWRFITGNVKGFINGAQIFSVAEPDTLSQIVQGTLWALPHNFYGDNFCVGKYVSPNPLILKKAVLGKAAMIRALIAS